jgi:anti-sigma factor RsiW
MIDPTKFTCADARPLVSAYLDDELSADRASPLRQHLIECAECRSATQGHKAQRQWFQPTPDVAVPAGFASRVARRAFQGDQGEVHVQASEHPQALAPVLPFVLRMTAAAALLLLVISVALRSVEIPTGGNLSADDAATMTLEAAIERLGRLDLEEGALTEDRDR